MRILRISELNQITCLRYVSGFPEYRTCPTQPTLAGLNSDYRSDRGDYVSHCHLFVGSVERQSAAHISMQCSKGECHVALVLLGLDWGCVPDRSRYPLRSIAEAFNNAATTFEACKPLNNRHDIRARWRRR